MKAVVNKDFRSESGCREFSSDRKCMERPRRGKPLTRRPVNCLGEHTDGSQAQTWSQCVCVCVHFVCVEPLRKRESIITITCLTCKLARDGLQLSVGTARRRQFNCSPFSLHIRPHNDLSILPLSFLTSGTLPPFLHCISQLGLYSLLVYQQWQGLHKCVC